MAAGWYRVAIAEYPALNDRAARGSPLALLRPDRAGLDREVLTGRENVFHFEIEVTK